MTVDPHTAPAPDELPALPGPDDLPADLADHPGTAAPADVDAATYRGAVHDLLAWAADVPDDDLLLAALALDGHRAAHQTPAADRVTAALAPTWAALAHQCQDLVAVRPRIAALLAAPANTPLREVAGTRPAAELGAELDSAVRAAVLAVFTPADTPIRDRADLASPLDYLRDLLDRCATLPAGQRALVAELAPTSTATPGQLVASVTAAASAWTEGTEDGGD